MVDYSKWDKIVVSDSDEDEPEEPPIGFRNCDAHNHLPNLSLEQMLRLRSGLANMGFGSGAPSGHSHCHGSCCDGGDDDDDEVSYDSDEEGEKPTNGDSESDFGKFKDCWDLPRIDMMEYMRTQSSYFGSKRPEEAMSERKMEKKIKEIELIKQQTKTQELCHCDYEITVTLEKINPHPWRKFRVSGGVTLNALHDKIIGPGVGWQRDYHAYKFIMPHDGSQIGPEGTRAVDATCHRYVSGWCWIPDNTVKLAYVVQKEGDTLKYLYDLGDNWLHHIVVNKVYPLSESNGKVVLLEGENPCPPENSAGKYNPKKDKNRFNIEAARRIVRESIASIASNQSGRHFVHSFITKDSDTDPNSGPMFFKEPNVKDPKDVALCFECGNPHNLKSCARCVKARYCSRDCQKANWASHRKHCEAPGAASSTTSTNTAPRTVAQPAAAPVRAKPKKKTNRKK